ncbi:MAG TPA: nucleotide sugar dehydrogenase [Acidisarcina sp.]
MKVVVVGAGKMGLPLACQLASMGAEVIACDNNLQLVSSINEGLMPFDEPGVGELLRQGLKSGALRASTNLEDSIIGVDVIIVIVPVLLTAQRRADLSAIEAVTHTISAHLRQGQMVCFETTLPVGTTRARLRLILELSGLRAGSDFDLVFSPERVKSGSVLAHLSNVPKIVGGVTSASAFRGQEFYARYLGAPVINVGTLEAAEFVKLAGMVYRDVNIGLANELAAYAEDLGIHLSSVIDAANTDGETRMLAPGIGVGGHCTPVYPYFLLQDATDRGIAMPLVSNARRINDKQAARLLDRVEQTGLTLADSALLILGLAFRAGVKEHTLSSAFLIQQEAQRRGARTLLHDPMYSGAEIKARGFVPFAMDGGEMPPVIVLNTGHTAYLQPDFAVWREHGVRLIVDGRNFWSSETVRRAGLGYLAPGTATEELVPQDEWRYSVN